MSSEVGIETLDELMETFYLEQTQGVEDSPREALMLAFWVGVVLGNRFPRTSRWMLSNYFAKESLAEVKAKTGAFGLAYDLAQDIKCFVPAD